MPARDGNVVYDMATAHDAYARLADVACPVLVACGSESEESTPDRARSHADRLPPGQSEVLDGVGHLGRLERPEQLTPAMVRFFSQAPSW